MILASTWPLARRPSSENSIKRLECFDDAVASAFGLQGSDDAALHQIANFSIGGVAIHFGDALVFRCGERFAMAVGVRQQTPLAKTNLRRGELIQPMQRLFIVDRGVAQRHDKEKSL